MRVVAVLVLSGLEEQFVKTILSQFVKTILSQFVKTILSQAHLSPLPLYVSPVFWAYDYSLRVYPLPDVLVTADKHDPFSVTSSECLCINPGSFPRSGFCFKVFYPSNKTVEDSKLQGL